MSYGISINALNDLKADLRGEESFWGEGPQEPFGVLKKLQLVNGFNELLEDTADFAYDFGDENLAKKLDCVKNRLSEIAPETNYSEIIRRIDRTITMISMFSDSAKINVDVVSSDTDRLVGSARKMSNKVFIVHGHDDKVLLEVELLIRKLELDPIVLRNKESKGHTIIEKFEEYSDVGFAIVLMTADDKGGSLDEVNAGNLKGRARQNVILELGFFIAKLSRSRVAVLRADDVEQPSDIFGLVYTPIDTVGHWQTLVAKELRGAGYPIDFNKLH